MAGLQFIVPGEPRGKGRPRFAMRGGKPRSFTDRKTEVYESTVAMAARDVMGGRPPLCGPVSVRVTAILPVPVSWPQWRREAALDGLVRPTGKPDGDNILKAIKDGCNAIIYADDAQVVVAQVAKVYGAAPRVVVDVEELAALPGSRGTKADLQALGA